MSATGKYTFQLFNVTNIRRRQLTGTMAKSISGCVVEDLLWKFVFMAKKKVNNQNRCPAMPGPVTYVQCREEIDI